MGTKADSPIRMLLVRNWIETDFREQLQDDDFIERHARLVNVGIQQNDHPLEVIRQVIASAVLDAANMPADESHN